MLRHHPPDLYNVFASGGNFFSTTIHVFNSAVCKLARAVRLPEGKLLYRGLGGLVELPDDFFKADERGCSGFAEWGFMSTTSKKEVAVSYSGVKESRPAPTVLVMKSGSVDRGACIAQFSQHPQVSRRLVGLPRSEALLLGPHNLCSMHPYAHEPLGADRRSSTYSRPSRSCSGRGETRWSARPWGPCA